MASCSTEQFPGATRVSKRQFTAAELVVVVVIAVTVLFLAAYLAASRRAKGKTEACLANLASIATAARTYSAESDGYLPPITTGKLPDVKLFSDLLAEHGAEEGDWLCPVGETNPSQINSGNGKLLHYGMNDFGYGAVDDCPLNYEPSLSGVQIESLAEPEAIVFIADARPEESPEDIGTGERHSDAWPLTSLAEDRHGDGYNAVYLGGAARLHTNTPNHRDWTCRKVHPHNCTAEDDHSH